MSRKPVDRLNGIDNRQVIWTYIRKVKNITVKDMAFDTGLDVSSVRDYLRGLTNAGYLEEAKSPKGSVFSLVKDVGVDAPRVRKDGTKVTQGQGSLNMWRTMRILRRFSARDLAIAASTETCEVLESSAERYIRHLCRAGYLRQDGAYHLFLPQMFTGPKPPMVQRVRRVWDQNLNQVMWSEDGGSDDD